jgi:membrane associated rhomboid family serine protease
MLVSRIKQPVTVTNLHSIWRYNPVVVFTPITQQRTTLVTRIHTIALRHHLLKSNIWRQPTKQLSSNFFQSSRQQSGYKHAYHTSSANRRNHADLVTPALISANVLVYAMWVYARWEQEAQPYTRSKLMTWMQRNFLCGPYNLWQENRWWTLITASFSHSELWHLGLNMFALYSFGPSVSSYSIDR